MSTITIEAWSSVSHLFGEERPPAATGKLFLQIQVAEGATLGTVLQELAQQHPRFQRVMFDSRTGQPTENVSVVINDRLPELLDGWDTAVRDQDRITLVQAYAGG